MGGERISIFLPTQIFITTKPIKLLIGGLIMAGINKECFQLACICATCYKSCNKCKELIDSENVHPDCETMKSLAACLDKDPMTLTDIRHALETSAE